LHGKLKEKEKMNEFFVAYQVSNPNQSITYEKYQQLIQALQKLDTSNKGGNFSSISCCLVNNISRKAWIIDSEASDHIVCENALFSDMHENLDLPVFVQLPNGNVTYVTITRKV